MFTLPVWVIGSVAIVVLVAILMATAVIKKSLRERSEKCERELLWERDKIRKGLYKKTFSVQVRTTKGTKTDMETALLGYMVDLELKVVDKKLEDLPEGVVMIVGVCDKSPHELSAGCTHYLDMRAASVDRETKVVQLRAARHLTGDSMQEVAHKTLMYLAEVLK